MSIKVRTVRHGAQETRPGEGCVSRVSFPDEWIERYGEPPDDQEARVAWIKLAVLDAEIETRQGKRPRPDWLGKVEVR